jgi:hypothetical protein
MNQQYLGEIVILTMQYPFGPARYRVVVTKVDADGSIEGDFQCWYKEHRKYGSNLGNGRWNVKEITSIKLSKIKQQTK